VGVPPSLALSPLGNNISPKGAIGDLSTMSTTLYESYQILAGSGNVIAIATAEATQAVDVAQVYILTTNTDCFIRFSGSAVAATNGNFDLFLPSGTSAILKATNGTLRVIRDSADGTLGFSQLEQV